MWKDFPGFHAQWITDLKVQNLWTCNFLLFQKQLQQYQTSAKQVPLNKRPPERGGCFPKRIWQSWNVTKQFANATNCLNDFWNVFATQNSKSYADSMTQQKDTKWQNFSMNTISSTSATGIPTGTSNFKTLTISEALYTVIGVIWITQIYPDVFLPSKDKLP